MCAGIGVLLIAVTMASCGDGSAEDNGTAKPSTIAGVAQTRAITPETHTQFRAAADTISEDVLETVSPSETTNPWTKDELDAIATTLAGECYDDKVQDKRKVCEVILNRVSCDGFPDTVLGVLTYPNAFCGYWSQSRQATESDYAVATQALRDWYGNGCQPLSNYLFFEAGDNRENVFREEY